MFETDQLKFASIDCNKSASEDLYLIENQVVDSTVASKLELKIPEVSLSSFIRKRTVLRVTKELSVIRDYSGCK